MSPHHRLTPSIRLLCVLTCAASLTGCGGAESDAPPPTPVLQELLAEGVVGPGGGRIEVTDPKSPHFGVGIVIPAGALIAPVTLRVLRVDGRLETLSTVDHYRFEPVDLPLRSAARITIGYRADLVTQLAATFAEEQLEVFDESGSPRLLETFERFPDQNRIALLSQRLGTLFALPVDLFLALHAETQLIDPEKRVPFSRRRGRTLPILNGEENAVIGRGSLADFFVSDATRNLLVVHGYLESPIDYTGVADWIPDPGPGGLLSTRANVIAFQYPSGRPISETANRLYELLLDRARRGFSTDVVAHGMGGLVIRYLLERSHLDQEVFFASAPPPRADTWVERVVLVGTPNLGVDPGALPLLGVFDRSGPADRRRLSGVDDLVTSETGLTTDLNQFFDEPEVQYFGIAGEVFDTRGDLFVSVLNVLQAPPALQSPLFSSRFLGGFEFEHLNLHAQAGTNGVLDQILRYLER